jgi:hypothetical protein
VCHAPSPPGWVLTPPYDGIPQGCGGASSQKHVSHPPNRHDAMSAQACRLCAWVLKRVVMRMQCNAVCLLKQRRGGKESGRGGRVYVACGSRVGRLLRACSVLQRSVYQGSPPRCLMQTPATANSLQELQHAWLEGMCRCRQRPSELEQGKRSMQTMVWCVACFGPIHSVAGLGCWHLGHQGPLWWAGVWCLRKEGNRETKRPTLWWQSDSLDAGPSCDVLLALYTSKGAPGLWRDALYQAGLPRCKPLTAGCSSNHDTHTQRIASAEAKAGRGS